MYIYIYIYICVCVCVCVCVYVCALLSFHLKNKVSIFFQKQQDLFIFRGIFRIETDMFKYAALSQSLSEV